MKKIYMALFLCGITATSFSQTFPWVKTGGNGTFIDYGLAVTVDNSHHVIATGMHFDNGTFGSTIVPGHGYQDAFVAKYDSTGTLMWVKGIGGADQDWGYAVTTDASDNIFVTGSYQMSNLHFTATDSLPISSSSAKNVFIAKYDANGNFLWARNGSSSNSSGTSITADASGNVIISGYYNGSVNFSSNALTGGASNLFFVKYSPAGTVIWAKSGTSSSLCYTNALKCDATGNIYSTGKISQNITFGSSTFTHQGGDDMYTAKFDFNGTIQWLHLEGKTLVASTTSNNFDCGNGIDVDNSGNVYVAGSLLDTFISASFYQSAAIVKYNSTGTKQWLYKFGNNNSVDVFNGIGLDALGNPYIVGTYKGSLTMGTSILPVASDDDVFIAKFNSAGTCTGTIGIGTGNGNDAGNGIAIDRNGGAVYLAGTIRNGLTFGTVNAVGDNAGNIFVAKMSGNAITGIEKTTAAIPFVLYPNPSNAFLNLQFEASEEYSIQIFNTMGQLLLSTPTNALTTQVDISGFPSGNYFMIVSDHLGNSTTGKFVKE
ncbi:hypothetical protein BH11BAC7_BH11BAC7_36130 [soil metagenome]